MDVKEIISLKNKLKNKYKVNTESLLTKIHQRIKYYALLKKDSCTYKIPSIIDYTPLFDIQKVTLEIFKKLDSEGYIVNAYSDGTLEICWDEKLVEQKARTDSFILSVEEKRLRNITKKNKNVDKRFDFIANPKKTVLSIEDQLDNQLEKILKEKKTEQNKYKKLL